jgi:3-deoxy-D-manno-octulosonic-acid transferase
VVHRYAPFDLPDATNRFLRRVKPRLAVMMEMELWPNTMAACRARQVPSVLINARMSEKSFRGYERFRRLITPVLQSFQQILAQSDEDAERIVRLGADAFRVEVSGSVKYDIRLDEADIKAGENLRQRLAANRPVWIAASTHGGEDELLLQAHGQVLKHYPDALLIIVPRHPQRFDAVAALCEKQAKMLGITFARRSQSKEERGVGVYLADTMGEMFTLLAASDICFMGGSLIPNGGHNLLEPAAVGMPTLIGPHDFNFTEITRLLVAAGNCQRVTDEHDLAAALIALFDDPSVAATAADAGRQVVANNQGALALTLSHIDEALAAGLSVH